MSLEQAGVTRAARELLAQIAQQYPNMGQGGFQQAVSPDLALVILSPQAFIQRLAERQGQGDSVGGLEVELVRLTERDILPYGTSTTYYLDKLLDARFADRVTLLVDSSCNQAVTVQTVGSPSNTPKEPATLVNIEASQSLAAGSTAVSRLSLGIDLEINWHFFLGVTIASGGTPPTTGGVNVMAEIRRHR